MDVYLLRHIHHAQPPDGSPIRHIDDDGDLIWDEKEDEIKLLGVYSSEQRAQERILQARTLPGFEDEPDCFHIDRTRVDRDHWTSGYFTYHY
ncbi:hypothetical protein AB0L82_42840 [Nocardia sp. NPDC052001]|uniref:DUF7336 domain-containing protein n=1 Tax=Nocardia sp. NPDC052001 TaxID=3154853 RepID=UPI003440935C